MRYPAFALSALAFVPAPTLQAQSCTVVVDINSNAAQSSFPAELHSRGGNLLLLEADDGFTGHELWRIDAGGAASLVKDINPGSGHGDPWELATCWNGTRLVTLFKANNGVLGRELWVTDGTGPGTALVLDIWPGSWGSSPYGLTACNNLVFFAADDGSHGYELWASDGTAAGTVMLKDINPGLPAADVGELTCCGGRLFFTANDGVHGAELWASDGTQAGTVMVKDIQPGGPSGSPSRLACCGDRVAFGASGANGNELWVSDGTPAGTVEVKDVRPGLASSILQHLTWTGDILYFSANDGSNGQELWRSDLTTAGTVMVKDISPGAGSSTPNNLLLSQGRLFFAATTPFSATGTGTELWVSDGTQAGTYEVADIYPGSASSAPSNLISVGTGIYFRALEPINGRELWFSDGSPAGTSVVCDIYPGSTSSFPNNMTISGGALFFVANDPTLGSEVHRVQPPGGTVERLGQGCGPTFPTLDATNPILGSAVFLSGRVAPLNQLGIVLLGAPAPPYTVLTVLGPGCSAWIDVNGLQAFTFTVTTSWDVTLPIPIDPGLLGAQAMCQTVYLGASSPFSTDNGVQLTVGA